MRCAIAEMFYLCPDLRADNAGQHWRFPGSAPRFAGNCGPLCSRLLSWRCGPKKHSSSRPKRGPRSSLALATAAVSLEVSESVLQYQLGNYGGALETLDAAQRSVSPRPDGPRQRTAIIYQAAYLMVLDRFEEAFEIVGAAKVAAQRDRQSWAIYLFEKWKGRQLLEIGRLADAASILEGRFTLELA